MANYTKGSEWRKWDLHIHTPLSITQGYGGEQQWEKFIESLERLPSEVKVIGITDYYFIDGYEKVMEYKNAGRLSNIDKIFPILEFRIDTFGSGNENNLQKINLHILFDVDESKLANEIKLIREEFISRIPLSKLPQHKTKNLSKDNLIKEGGDLQNGFANLIPSTDEVLSLLQSEVWKNKVFLFLGYKEWSNLEKNNQLKPTKAHLYNQVSAFFTANITTYEKSQVWLNEFGSKPLLHSGDIHSFDFLDTANKDENGGYLKSEKYCCHTWIKADPSFEGLKQIVYEPALRCLVTEGLPEDKAGYQVIDKVEISYQGIKNEIIEFNPNLNSIIGGRSAGKSVLLTAIAKKLKTDIPIEFPLKPTYGTFVQGIADEIKVYWKDGEVNNEREIEFFQQGYMYDLASNVDKLNNLIQDILKQKDKNHVIKEFEQFKSDHKKTISLLVSNLFDTSKDIKQRKLQEKELGDKKGIEDELFKLNTELDKISKTTISDSERDTYHEIKKEIDKKENLIRINRNDREALDNLKATEIFKDDLQFKLTSVSQVQRDKLEKYYFDIKQEAQSKWSKFISEQKANLESEKVKLNIEIEELKINSVFTKVNSYIQESSFLSELEAKIQIQKNKLQVINTLMAEIATLEKQLKSLKEKLLQAPLEYSLKINALTTALHDEHDGLKIIPTVKFNDEGFSAILLSALNQVSAQSKTITQFVFKDTKGYSEKLATILEEVMTGSLLLKSGSNSESLCHAIFTECFFTLNYELDYENDKFDQMSDGKKAFVVLKLLLDFSKKNCPILIDQPEDDLDNRAIYQDLVQYLKKKKQIRQIIVATHNPNIVVGADSELVIVANQHGVKNENQDGVKFEYSSGSLECSFAKKNIKEVLLCQGIREHVCEILEGGDVAFKLREKKYSLARTS